MQDKNIDAILDEIDEAVGPPEAETPEEREKRKQMIERDVRARQIRKSANDRA